MEGKMGLPPWVAGTVWWMAKPKVAAPQSNSPCTRRMGHFSAISRMMRRSFSKGDISAKPSM